MMDMLTVIVLLIVGFVIVKKKLLPRLKNKGQEPTPEKEGGAAMRNENPDFTILSFCSADFTNAEDFAHCVEFELGKEIRRLTEKGCRLIGDPFPVVVGEIMLIVLYYSGGTEKKEESQE